MKQYYCVQSERLPSNSSSTAAHRPTFVNSFVMSDCSKSRRARGNKICQSLLQNPPWNCKGNEERLKLESNVCLWKLIYTHIALEAVRELPGSCNSNKSNATDVVISFKQESYLILLEGSDIHTKPFFQALCIKTQLKQVCCLSQTYTL